MIKTFTNRAEWLAEVRARGLRTVVEVDSYEGPHPSDVYAAEVARDDEERELGTGGLVADDEWHGELADTPDEFLAYVADTVEAEDGRTLRLPTAREPELPAWAYPDEENILVYPRLLGAANASERLHIVRPTGEVACGMSTHRTFRTVDYSPRRRPVCAKCRAVDRLDRQYGPAKGGA